MRYMGRDKDLLSNLLAVQMASYYLVMDLTELRKLPFVPLGIGTWRGEAGSQSARIHLFRDIMAIGALAPSAMATLQLGPCPCHADPGSTSSCSEPQPWFFKFLSVSHCLIFPLSIQKEDKHTTSLTLHPKSVPNMVQQSTNDPRASSLRKHHPSAGTPFEITAKTPAIFTPLTIRSITLRNRICISPMCMYSLDSSGPEIGVLTPLYVATLGHCVFKGAALAMLEATGVQPNGRISPNCPGLWNETQQHALKSLVDFIHSQGGLCGVQLSHAGRKASTLPPLLATRLGKYSAKAEAADDGWPEDVVGPTGGEAQSWDGKKPSDPSGGYHTPKEMTTDDIKDLVGNYARAAERAVKAGTDVVEIHGAHGYLLHQFLSPISNRRNDMYGGSFENRTRLLIEVTKAVRAVVPSSMPVFVRISATDWMEETPLGRQLGSWDEESTLRLARLFPDLGVDLLDVSTGGNHPDARFNVFDAGEKQHSMAVRIKKALRAEGHKLLIGTVGMITGAEQARDLVQGDATKDSGVDIISVGRQFLREPDWVLKVAAQLGVDVAWPAQVERLRSSL